ncbi:MAG TPA: aspartate kinase, partial [Thermoanaerobaculia bacterium]
RRAAAAVDRVLAELVRVLGGVALLGECSPASRDRVLAAGERLAAPVVAAALGHHGVAAVAVDAVRLLVTDSSFGEAEVDAAASAARVRALFARLPAPLVAVVTGFVAADASGRVTTLGRGGSDYTAALLGAFLAAERVEIWTDVDGVCSAEPQAVPEARRLGAVSYELASELAWHGGRVLHPRTMEPLAPLGIPIEVRNTLRPEAPGSLVLPDAASPAGGLAISSRPGSTMLRVESDRAVDLAASAQRAARRAGLRPQIVSQTRPGRCLLVVAAAGAAALAAFERELARATAGRAGALRVERTDGVATVAAVGEGGALAGRFLATLARSRVRLLAVAGGDSSRSLVAAVPGEHLAPARAALHRAVVVGRPRLHLVVVGATGRVGGELLRQVAAGQRGLETRVGAELVLAAAGNTRGFARAESGLPPADVGRLLAGPGLLDVDGLLAWLERAAADPVVLVDCTAAAEVAALYPWLLERRIAVVTANKLAPAGPLAAHRRLLDLSERLLVPYRFETTAGAALPLLHALEGLRLSGDRLRGLSAVLSGSLSYLCRRMGEEASFSAAVREAHGLGYTEPRPWDDLSGEDVARKLVILLREAGLPTERGDVAVERLLPWRPAPDDDVDAFLARLGELDDAWRQRVEAARAAGRRLVPLARFDAAGPRFGVETVEADSPFAALAPGGNLVIAETDRYDRCPLSIGGPGAGPAVTAAGVLADVVAAARQLVGGASDEPGEAAP